MCDKMNDDEALMDIRKGGKCGFVVLYRRYEPKVYNYVISKGVPESDRDDVIQDIFFQLFKTLVEDRFKQECSLSTWFYEITKNIVCDYWRQQQKTQSNLENLSECEETEEEGNQFFQESSEYQSEQAHNDLESQICVEHLLAKLKCSDAHLNNCLKVLLLHAQGESQKDIAALINRTVEATRKYIFDCSKKLRQYSPLRDCW
jgi:RNA polymerase sigma-70 factor (ECF subfamily)